MLTRSKSDDEEVRELKELLARTTHEPYAVGQQVSAVTTAGLRQNPNSEEKENIATFRRRRAAEAERAARETGRDLWNGDTASNTKSPLNGIVSELLEPTHANQIERDRINYRIGKPAERARPNAVAQRRFSPEQGSSISGVSVAASDQMAQLVAKVTAAAREEQEKNAKGFWGGLFGGSPSSGSGAEESQQTPSPAAHAATASPATVTSTKHQRRVASSTSRDSSRRGGGPPPAPPPPSKVAAAGAGRGAASSRAGTAAAPKAKGTPGGSASKPAPKRRPAPKK